ncbi:MAG: TonB-dependent receptor, partial [Emcibacteraceae bacterium]|nr:TonB-dependent receptor [Emcibacteraceae bacterium]
MKQNIKGKFLMAASHLIVASCIISQPLYAQEQNTADDRKKLEVDIITVTASKRGAQLLREVPTSIQALSGNSLERAGIVEFADYATRVPGLSFQDLGPGDKEYVIRGTNSTGAAMVGVYYDEAIISANNANDGGGRNADIRLFDLERIEVLKGPQGTLYGASSMTGTIRIITKKPDATEISGYVASELSGTSEGGTNYNFNGAINLPIIEDKLAMRATGWKVDNSGFIDAPRIPSGPLENINNDKTSGARFQVRLTPNDDFTLLASATNQTTHSDGSSRFTPEGTMSFGDVGAGFPSIPGGDLINTDITRSPWDEEIQIYSLTGEYDLGNGTLVATTNWFERDIDFSFDSSPILFFFGVPIAGITYEPQSRRIWSNEIRYNSNYDGPFNFLVGGFYSKEKKDFDVQVLRSNGFGEINGPFSRLNSDDALSNADGNTFFGRFDNTQLRQYALFGEAFYEVTSDIIATVGIRHFNSKMNATQETTHPFGGFGPNPEGVVTNKFNDKKTTFKANLSWKPNDDMLVYANAAQGFRTGGLNQANLPFASGIPEGYGSDTLWSYEVGTKFSLMDNRVSIDLAAYLIDWSDIQVQALDDTGAFPFTTNAGKARVEGFEGTISAIVSEGVTFSAGASYQNARLTEDQPEPNTGLSGDRIANVPEITGNINIDVMQPINDKVDFIMNANISHRGGSQTDTAVTLDSYTTANIRAGIELED